MSVEALLADARAYTSTLVDQAADAMGEATSAVAAVGYSYPNAPSLGLPSTPEQGVDLVAPTLTTIDLVLPAAPAAELVFQDIPPVALGVAPQLTAEAPAITLPTDPSQLAAFLVMAPAVDTSITFPSPPAELMSPLLAAPVLTDRSEPVKPQVLLPVFDTVRPTDDTVAPTNLDVTLGNAYSTAAPSMVTAINGYVDDMLAKRNPQYAAQMVKIETQLSAYLAGGTALDPAVEDAIYTRARSKNNAEARRVRDAAYNEAADRGFTMPGGALLSAMQQARQAAADLNAKAATEIAVAQAEMEQKNLQFAVTTSTGLRTTMLNASISYMQGLVGLNGQALEYAKSVLNAVVETYNISLRAFTAKMEVYKADAQVYETKLRGALAGIELYRAEVAALEALTQVDRSKVDVYRARIESLNALSNVYRAQIEAVQGRAGLERLKLDVFQSQVQAYAAQVQAKNAEWQGYSAAIEGQVAKTRIFNSQVDAFGAQVQSYKAQIEAQSEAVRAMATTNDSRSRNYAAAWSAYETIVQSLGEVARTKLENQRQEIIAFQAETSLAVANAQVSNEYYRSVAQVAVENAKLELQAQIEGSNSQREYGRAIAQLGTANAQIYAGLANAAMSGMNTLAAETLAEG
jgi:hypothetical protein